MEKRSPKTTASMEDVRRVMSTDHHDPFSVLGAHLIRRRGKPAVAIRAFLPDAEAVLVVEEDGTEHRMIQVLEGGFFEVVIPGRTSIVPYSLRRSFADGSTQTFRDPYSFLPTLTDYDLYLFNAGDHHRVFEKLGAHFAEIDGVEGVQFAVWAPDARSVSVIGDFNQWDRRKHAMRALGVSGVWEIFLPGLAEGEKYKFQIKTRSGEILDKTDPYATEMEHRPRTASVVNFLRDYRWGDDAWMKMRSESDHLGEPVSVYEVHLGSWARRPEEGNRWLSYGELADELIPYVRKLGFTHVELLPVMEHPFDGSWGYQVTGYFAPTSRHGRPTDLMNFIDRCHQEGIGVILDWVPAHFPRDEHALARFDGSHLYEHADPRMGEHPDWGTLIFNFGRREVRNFLVGNALFWLEKYHADGLRIDAVASMLYLDYSRKEGEWVPNAQGGRENLDAMNFLRDVNRLAAQYWRGTLIIAEESTAWTGVTKKQEIGGLGFSLKWNMGWMHDMLEYFSKDPVHRKHHQNKLTFALLYAFSERFLLPLSHDEVVHGKSALVSKMPGDDWQKFANLRLLFGLMYGFPGKKLLFMGGEFAQRDEWSHERSLDWHLLRYEPHSGVQRWVGDLNKFYRSAAALFQVDFHPSGFEWIDFHDEQNSIISFLRRSADGSDEVVVVCNFTPVSRGEYRVGVPGAGRYVECLNSDSQFYGGGNVGNNGVLLAESVPANGRTASVKMMLPPLAAVFLRREKQGGSVANGTDQRVEFTLA